MTKANKGKRKPVKKATPPRKPLLWDDVHNLFDETVKAVHLRLATIGLESEESGLGKQQHDAILKIKATLGQLSTRISQIPPRGTVVKMSETPRYHQAYTEMHALAEEMINPALDYLHSVAPSKE